MSYSQLTDALLGVKENLPNVSHHSCYQREPSQMATMIDFYSQKLLDNEYSMAKVSLANLRDQVCQFVDIKHIQLFSKAQATLYYAVGDYDASQAIIVGGFFEEHHHYFFQELFRKIQERKLGKKLPRLDYFCYPSSIDSMSEDGLPKSISDYLKLYYTTKKMEKKALDVKSVAKATGLSENVVDERFKFHRKRLMKPNKRKTVNKSSSKNLELSEKTAVNYQGYQNLFANGYSWISPTAPIHEFPLTRLPITLPLTIEIPQDPPMYFPAF